MTNKEITGYTLAFFDTLAIVMIAYGSGSWLVTTGVIVMATVSRFKSKQLARGKVDR